nr:MAG TPA: hypothetical protein [Herelleviridae sp.]
MAERYVVGLAQGWRACPRGQKAENFWAGCGRSGKNPL